jgi:uncharacterized protein (TIGR02145 family)
MMLRVYHKNRHPAASFSVSSLTGNLNTRFRFDSWSTRDPESSPTQMTYRWDFDGDGNWDTDYMAELITMHQYDKPGVFRTRMEVKDPLGELDTISKWIYISKGTNPTEIIDDRRGEFREYYGTVRIGDQWWFTRNMAIHDTVRFYQFFYDNEWQEYYDNGNLYLHFYVTGICPAGWRVPSKEDWDILFSNYPQDKLYEALTPGGESDFGATFGGMGYGTRAKDAVYNGKDQYGYYWSSTKPADGDSPSIWIITFDKAKRQVLKGFYDYPGKLYSVRCVKDAE